MRVDFDTLVRTCVEILTRRGVSLADATLQAEWLAEANARHHDSHGVQRMATLDGRLRAGLISVEPRIGFDWRSSVALSVDADHALGPVAACAAIDQLLPRARAHGIAIAAIRNSNHLGMLAGYVERIAEEGMIGMVFTTSEALVHPWGGSEAMVGTNPIGIGVPSNNAPLIVDMATSEVSAGRILAHHATGTPLGEGWAVDEFGESTLDPAEAMRGALSPFGGAKGYALGAALEALVGAVSGTAFGPEKRGTLDAEDLSTKGDTIIAIDPRVIDPEYSPERVGDYFDSLRRSTAKRGGVAVRVPGDRARADSATSRRDGIELSEELWEDLRARAAGERAGVHG